MNDMKRELLDKEAQTVINKINVYDGYDDAMKKAFYAGFDYGSLEISILLEALQKATCSAQFFKQHADCRNTSWNCKCSFCKDTSSSKNLREAKEILDKYRE